jgi:hypothetical protein
MANFAYSFLDDAWAEEKGTAGSAACDKLGTKPLDAIMQSYVGEESKCLKPTISMIPEQKIKLRVSYRKLLYRRD